ncbi:Putative SET domain-containing protein [Septoria linicola]|uniref:SET domain-containing protein n=1 Tax=Septoria linicola TaxID=215465 RepID=A0A9Q9AIV7_9PEZI|nr:putative SET domain-containing protein [Septoria linicola]USW47260.1 Putative SET domain-containing protein [Septoria linicola]
MDEYKMSIANVDNALNRLNQTLAAYKLSASSATKPSSSQSEGNGKTAIAEPSLTGVSVSDSALPTPNGLGSSNLSAELSRLLISLRSTTQYPENNVNNSTRLERLDEAFQYVVDNPYSIPIHVFIAVQFLGLGYPDLAAGSAYKALLLSDALEDDAEEYHDKACESMKIVIQKLPLEERIKIIRQAMDAGVESGGVTAELDPTLDIEITLWLKVHYRLILYRILTRSLLLCSCFRTGYSYAQQSLALYQDDPELLQIRNHICSEVARLDGNSNSQNLPPPSEWPDSGFVRRELYHWNEREPDRIADLERINMLMGDVSDKLEVRAVDLPDLTGDSEETVTQLGVFAKVDIQPGEIILNETSLLTANNKLQDALCDACSGDLPEVGSPEWEKAVVCEECEVVFCSDWCFEHARDSYHPALCDKDVDSIAKDVPPAQAADSLYSLLLLRALAMAETQEWHPLELLDVRYIWGDFSPSIAPDTPTYRDLNSPSSCLVPRTLPFSFEYNVRLPFHMLEKMDVDIFTNPQYDVWVFNTLYAKFRGTASARLSGLGGRAIRGPEVSAVHPMWCLANHSCDPNVSWEWGGAMKFWAKEERVAWMGRDGKKVVKSQAGIQKDEEIMNHYCDVDLPVKERREWARGALGGDCSCARCVFEADAETN